MRRFHFPLERLLWHRRCQEDQAELAVAAALREESQLATDLAHITDLARREAATLRMVLIQHTSGADLALCTGFLARLATQERRLLERRKAAMGVLRERRAVLQERRRACEVLEKLRERALARYRKAVEREEQSALDEAGSVRHIRRVLSTEAERGASKGNEPCLSP